MTVHTITVVYIVKKNLQEWAKKVKRGTGRE